MGAGTAAAFGPGAHLWADEFPGQRCGACGRVVLSYQDRSILLLDQHGSRVELNPGGVFIDTPRDMQVTAKGRISLEAVGGVSISSMSDVVVASGLNVRCEAQVGFVAGGGASADLSTPGQAILRGGIVMINGALPSAQPT